MKHKLSLLAVALCLPLTAFAVGPYFNPSKQLDIDYIIANDVPSVPAHPYDISAASRALVINAGAYTCNFEGVFADGTTFKARMGDLKAAPTSASNPASSKKGKYSAGFLQLTIAASTGLMCTYDLNTETSAYFVARNKRGLVKHVWDIDSAETNTAGNAGCLPSFTSYTLTSPTKMATTATGLPYIAELEFMEAKDDTVGASNAAMSGKCVKQP
ncbi:MAG: hypothetical protein HOP21_01600 [Methylotenera sp.]|nr:hypothetical protein [Methylotenera sp.]